MKKSGLVLVVVMAVALSTGAGAASGQTAAAGAGTWTAPRTPDGQPDLQGIWDFRTITPMERPTELAGKEVLTPEEAASFREETLRNRDKDLRAADGISTEQDVANAYNDFWWDYGTTLTDDRRTSLIVNPLDGTIPALSPHAASRAASPAAQRFEATRNGVAPASSWEDMDLGDRCILGFNAGPPMTPSAYNNNMQLLQTPGYVAVYTEMVHDARLVPLDGRGHLPGHLRQWVGDSRGHWEGDTLVVETTNFLRETNFVRGGSTSELHLIERFTRVSRDTLQYEVTVEDRGTWTRPWTFVVPMKKSDAPIYEYACHEGNYGMTNLLAGSRAQDTAAAPSGSK